MEAKNRKIVVWIVALVLVLGVAVGLWQLLRKDPESPESPLVEPRVVRLIDNGEDNPRSDAMLQLHSQLLVSVNGDTAYLVIDSLSQGYAQGRYYLMVPGSDTIRPLHYAISLHKRSIDLVLDTTQHLLSVREDEVEALLDGALHDVEVDGVACRVGISSYEVTPFHEADDQRYTKSVYPVNVTHDIVYGRAEGYWTSLTGGEGDGYAQILLDGLKQSRSMRSLDLTLDLYEPDDRSNSPHPLLLMLHGGAFYVGDKSDSACVLLCRHFASLGYIAASVNYRMGFQVSKSDIERTGYMAVQDAHAAVRYLLAADTAHRINPSQLFVAGTSAGSITALNLVYMTNDTRPASSFRKKNRKRFPDLGDIDASGNSHKADFHFCAIANMWGALTDLDMMKDSRTPILSIHGDADQLVPYDQGYPFADVSRQLGKRLFGMMYGSASIHRYAQRHGIRSQLVTIPGAGHAPQLNDDRTINRDNYALIERSMRQFFYRTLVPVDPAIVAGADPRTFVLNGAYSQVEWEAEGGIVLQRSDSAAEVVWLSDQPRHGLRCTLRHPSGLEFTIGR